jgi:hypothetical protein
MKFVGQGDAHSYCNGGPQAEPEGRAEPRAEPRGRAEPRAEPGGRAEPKAEPYGRAEPRPEPRAEPEAEPEAEAEPRSSRLRSGRKEAEPWTIRGRRVPKATNTDRQVYYISS